MTFFKKEDLIKLIENEEEVPNFKLIDSGTVDPEYHVDEMIFKHGENYYKVEYTPWDPFADEDLLVECMQVWPQEVTRIEYLPKEPKK